MSETRRILGIDLDAETVTSLLERLGFVVEGLGPLQVTVPTRRPDVQRPVDLVEEIARLHGFEGIPDSVPQGPGHGLPYREERLRAIREILVGAGYHEFMTFSFIGSEDLDRLGFGEGHAVRSAIGVVNPLNDAEGVMRTTLLPGVLKAAAGNLARRTDSVRLFEVGKVFLEGSGKLPEQPDRLALVVAGVPDADWLEASREPDVYDGTGTWSLLADKLRIPDSELRQASHPPFHPGRCADIVVGDVVIGAVGEIHPSVAGAFGLSGRVVAAEFDLAELLIDRGPWQFVPPSVYPPVVFDLSFSVDNAVPASAVLASIASAAGPHLESTRVFDVFEGESIGEGKKSLAVAIRLRAPDRTLTDEDAGPIRAEIAAAVSADVGGQLRGAV